MDSLAGELTTMELGEVLSLVGSKRLTGRLTLEQGSVAKIFYIQDGQITLSDSSLERESFALMLRQFERIGEQDLARADEAKKREGTLLGVQLVRLGLMTQEDVRQNLVARTRETMLDAVQWMSGTFRFERGALPEDRPAIDAAVDLVPLLQEVEFRKTVWDTMRQVFPSEHVTLVPHEEKLPRGLQAGSLDSRIFALIHQGETLAGIGEKLFRSPFFLYQKMYALYRQGAIGIGPEKRPDEPMFVGEPVDDVAQMMRMARSFMNSGRFSQAELMASQIVEMSPTPEAQQLLGEIESAHLQALQASILQPNPAPRMTCDIRTLKGLSLSPQEKYLLSRIDGSRTVRMLLRVTPMREFDALKCLEHFVEAGYIELPVAIP